MVDDDEESKAATPHSFGEVLEPSEAIEPILARPVRAALLEWLTEIWAEEELKAAKLKPRKKAIFDGPPGTGKTTLAHHLSARLGLPMLVVRPEMLISKWVGQTAMQIGALFTMARNTDPPLVLFLDEFDAIAVKRGAAEQASDHERNAYVNTLLQRVEQHDGFIITATNFAKHIDPAIWRRFDVHITLETPGQFERERILARYLDPWGLAKPALKALAMSFETASPALMRQFCEALKRNLVIGPKVGWNMQRESVIERILAANKPHPDLGLPRLWSHGTKDAAVRELTWPLPLAADIPKDAKVEEEPADNVVPMPTRGAA
jgi:hypothetical protein